MRLEEQRFGDANFPGEKWFWLANFLLLDHRESDYNWFVGYVPWIRVFQAERRQSGRGRNIGRARGKKEGKNTLNACVVSLLLFGQLKSIAARKAINLIGQVHFDRMTGPPLVKEHWKKVLKIG